MYIGYIYKITCLKNNKCYVGSKVSKKFVENYWSSSLNKNYWDDLKKYGKENFKREILCWCKTKIDLRQKEKAYILSENALTSKGGYNQALGANTIIFTETVKNKMKLSAKIRWKKLTAEEKNKYSEFRRRIALDPNGTIQSKAYKEKMSKIVKGRKRYTNGKIDIFIKGPCPEGFYPGTHHSPKKGIKQTVEQRNNLSKKHLSLNIGKKWWNDGNIQKFQKECPGIEWKAGRLNPHWNSRKIFKHKCLCIELNKIFQSIKEAALWLNIKDYPLETVRCAITRCCNKKIDDAFNYHWKYID